MKISYINSLNAAYMVVDNETEEGNADFTVKMLTENNIPYLLKCSSESVNGKTHFLYNITSLRSFSRAFANEKLGKETILAFLRSFRDMIDQMEDHLLSSDDILLQADTIYVDESRQNYFYCCVPGLQGNIRDMLVRLSAEILMMIDYEDRQAVKLAFDLNRIAASDSFSLADMNRLAEDRVLEVEPIAKVLEMDSMIDNLVENEKIITESVNGIQSAETKVINSEIAKKSFFSQMKGYFKGKGFFEIMEDINAGGVTKRIKSWNSRETVLPASASPEQYESAGFIKPFSEITYEEIIYSEPGSKDGH